MNPNRTDYPHELETARLYNDAVAPALVRTPSKHVWMPSGASSATRSKNRKLGATGPPPAQGDPDRSAAQLSSELRAAGVQLGSLEAGADRLERAVDEMIVDLTVAVGVYSAQRAGLDALLAQLSSAPPPST